MFAWPAFSLYPLITTTYFHGSISDASIVLKRLVHRFPSGGLSLAFLPRLNADWQLVSCGGLSGRSRFTLMGFLPDNRYGLWLFIAFTTLVGGCRFHGRNGSFMSIVQQAFPAKQTGRIMGIAQAMTSMASPIVLIFAKTNLLKPSVSHPSDYCRRQHFYRQYRKHAITWSQGLLITWSHHDWCNFDDILDNDWWWTFRSPDFDDVKVLILKTLKDRPSWFNIR